MSNQKSQNDFSTNKRTLKSYLPDYLSSKGIDISKKFHCLNPNHADHTPSMSYNKDKEEVHCFGCRATYDVFDLYAIDNLGATNFNECQQYFKQAFKQVAELYGVNVGNYTQTPENTLESKIRASNRLIIEQAQANIDQAAPYLKSRGISLEVAKEYGLGYKEKWVNPSAALKTGKELIPTPRLIIPSSSTSYLARDTRKDIPENQKPYIKQKQGAQAIFNKQALLDDSRPIFIVEGELDALSIIESTDNATAIGLGSVSNVEIFKKELLNAKRQVTAQAASNGRSYDPVFYLACDRDDAGRQANSRLAQVLNNFDYEAYTVDILVKGTKDPNESLLADPAQFRKKIELRIKDPDNYLVNLFTRIKERKKKPQYIPTGFNELDKKLDGGLYPQLYVIGAVSSLGKTTFTMQIADRIASRQGRPVLIFSLETSKDELTEKNLSRLTFELSNSVPGALPQTSRALDNGYFIDHIKESELVMNAVTAYEKYYTNLYIYDGVTSRPSATDIYNRVDKFCNKHNKPTDLKPVVIVDYLQILKPINDRDTDKEKVTKSIAEFKKIAAGLGVPVIVISSFNRSSYKDPVSMSSFKESGEIEYYADTLIGLQYQVQGENLKEDDMKDALEEARDQNPREIQAVLLKNRNGASNSRVNFKYYPMFNDFIE